MKAIIVKSSKHFSAHKLLLHAADNYLLAAQNNERFCADGHFVSLIMSALAVESLCNTTGELVFTDWKSYVRCSPREKVRLICERLSITYDKQTEPFHTLLWINQFRNDIAHAKPEPMNEEIEMTESDYAELCSGDGPQSQMEQNMTIDHAKKALGAVTALQEMIFEKLTDDKKYLVACDFWETEVTVVPAT